MDEQRVHQNWADVPHGYICRYLAGVAGWVMETCHLNCPALPHHRRRLNDLASATRRSDG